MSLLVEMIQKRRSADPAAQQRSPKQGCDRGRETPLDAREQRGPDHRMGTGAGCAFKQECALLGAPISSAVKWGDENGVLCGSGVNRPTNTSPPSVRPEEGARQGAWAGGGPGRGRGLPGGR